MSDELKVGDLVRITDGTLKGAIFNIVHCEEKNCFLKSSNDPIPVIALKSDLELVEPEKDMSPAFEWPIVGFDDTTSGKIVKKCRELSKFLQDKNQSYGDSALHPVEIFGKIPAGTLLKARIHDKLTRIEHLCKGGDGCGESYKDSVMDLTGYLILELIRLDGEGK